MKAVVGMRAGVLPAAMPVPGEEGEACGGANGGTGVGVGEADAIFGEAIDVWGEDMGGAVATKISVADIVGEDVEDIGERAWGLGGLRGRGEEEEGRKGREGEGRKIMGLLGEQRWDVGDVVILAARKT